MDDVTAVVVSYQQDLDKLSRCLASVLTRATDLKRLIIVVNDDPAVVPLFNKLAESYPIIQVVHCAMLGNWTGPLDWWSQQYFKLAVSQIVDTSWYLLLDSDDIIIQDLTEQSLFDQGRARCLTEDSIYIEQSTNRELLGWLQRARSYLDLDQQVSWTMGNLTPMLMHTQTTKQLFEKITTELFDITQPEKLTLEFYLYHAWLEQQGLFEKLYKPVEFLGYALDKRGI